MGRTPLLMSDDEILKRIASYVKEDNFVYNYKSKKWLTYNDIWRRAYNMANYFAGNNFKKIIAVMDNGIALFSLYFACIISGTVIVPIDPQKSEKEIEAIISEHDDYCLLNDGADLFSLECVKVDCESILEKIYQIDLNKIFMITYTSGSTGHAKGVIHSLRNLCLAAEDFGKITGLNDRHIMCHVMPMTYMAGILNTIIMPFFFGAKIVLFPRFDVMSAVKFWENVKKLHVTAFWLSPTMLNLLMMLDKKGNAKDYLSSVDPLFYIGTAPLYETIRQNFENKYDVKLLQSYGLSETLFISTEAPYLENDVKSVGTLLPDVQIEIDSDDEIKIGVPWMFLGYSNENTAEYFCDGKYKSGDMGAVDEKNRLFLTGRKKDLIIKGGMNISPVQIEKCVIKFTQISECAVAGVNVHDEENIVCWYVLKSGTDISHAEVNRFLEKELGRNCRVDFFCSMDNIPKNLNGKIDKKKLVREFSL